MPSYAELAKRLLDCTSRELGAGVSDDEIAAAERALEVRIEGGYRQFLKQFGWGGVEHLELHGLGGSSHLDLVRVTQSERSEMEPALPVHLVPVMNDGGGNLFCLDTHVANEPPIVFWDHTGGVDQEPEVEAESFSSWLLAQLDELG
jgi:hypothetical protein